LRTEPLKALVIGAFVRGLSMPDVESLCDQAGLGKLSKSTASRTCEQLRRRYEQFKRRDLYELGLVALFLDATFISVRPSGPKEGVLVAWGFTEEGDRETEVTQDLSPGQAADQTGLSRTLIYREIERGHLRAYRVGGRLRITLDALAEWKQLHAVVPRAQPLRTSRDLRPHAEHPVQIPSRPSYGPFELGGRHERPEGGAVAGRLARGTPAALSEVRQEG
jgi:excisionase family DNA binding protein